MSNINYKKGDRIVALKDHSDGLFKIGDEFICTGFTSCDCGRLCTTIDRRLSWVSATVCPDCRKMHVPEAYYAQQFIKKPSHGELIEYRLKVSAPELIEIKEPQLS